MNPRHRWQIALPLISICVIVFAAAVLGMTFWHLESLAGRVLRIAMLLVATATLAVAVSVGVRPASDVPWPRIGVVVAGLGLTCGLSAIHFEVA
ncbi:hypothetical protein [Plantactinospora sp. B5E13]|uniref:hypothetical protein n=1 Tax=unclassified Plantactinospora TaxID=2631981 RepID=UPI00325CD022